MNDLLEHDLAHDQIDDLDIAPPTSLLTALSRRSGIGLDQLRCMSFSGWVPRLFDCLDNNFPAALEAYALQLSVLLPRGRRKPDRSPDGVPGELANQSSARVHCV